MNEGRWTHSYVISSCQGPSDFGGTWYRLKIAVCTKFLKLNSSYSLCRAVQKARVYHSHTDADCREVVWLQAQGYAPQLKTHWKHTASFPGFEGKTAASKILQKKHLEQQNRLLLLHLLLETMVSPAQLVINTCSSLSPKSWPSLIITEVTFVSVFTAGYQIYWDTDKGKPKLFVQAEQ